MKAMDLLLVLLATLHLLAMNVATAGPFVCLWLGWRTRKRSDALAAVTGRWLLMQSLLAFTGGIVLGGLLLAAVWVHRPEPFFRSAELIPRSRYWFGIAEIGFTYVLLLVVLATWRRAAGRWWQSLLNLMAATNTIYHFPTLFASIVILSQRPTEWRDAELTRSALLEIMRSPETIAHVLHFGLASFAVTGVALLGFAARLAKREATEADAARVTMWGGWLALVPTALNLVSGIWLLLESPRLVQNQLTGDDGFATAAFLLAIVAALAMLPSLAAAAFGTAGRKERLRAMILLTVTILAMTTARHFAHQRMYDSYAKPAAAGAR